MIGDKDLAIRKEAISDRYAPEIVKRVWDSAKRVGAKAFVEEGGAAITDDHVPFLKRGIRVVDLIDFDYRPWHTLADTAEKCSADSLQQIGDVLVDVIYGE
jgi:Zn-dependent M28 family amino/carboxypeptidase